MKGIYSYTDLNTNDIVYIGKDSHIEENRRHKQHLNPSSYNEQHINRVLQNNPHRYHYEILCSGNDCDNELLNILEMGYIQTYAPKFNFTKGGEGLFGFNHSEETKKKQSELMKGRYDGKNHPMYGKPRSIETRMKISKANKGKKITMETRKKISESSKGKKRNIGKNHPLYGKTGEENPFYGKKHSKESKLKISESLKNKYATISKRGIKNNKQRYSLKFNGKDMKTSYSKESLINWFLINFPLEIIKTR